MASVIPRDLVSLVAEFTNRAYRTMPVNRLWRDATRAALLHMWNRGRDSLARRPLTDLLPDELQITSPQMALETLGREQVRVQKLIYYLGENLRTERSAERIPSSSMTRFFQLTTTRLFNYCNHYQTNPAQYHLDTSRFFLGAMATCSNYSFAVEKLHVDGQIPAPKLPEYVNLLTELYTSVNNACAEYALLSRMRRIEGALLGAPQVHTISQYIARLIDRQKAGEPRRNLYWWTGAKGSFAFKEFLERERRSREGTAIMQDHYSTFSRRITGIALTGPEFRAWLSAPENAARRQESFQFQVDSLHFLPIELAQVNISWLDCGIGHVREIPEELAGAFEPYARLDLERSPLRSIPYAIYKKFERPLGDFLCCRITTVGFNFDREHLEEIPWEMWFRETFIPRSPGYRGTSIFLEALLIPTLGFWYMLDTIYFGFMLFVVQPILSLFRDLCGMSRMVRLR